MSCNKVTIKLAMANREPPKTPFYRSTLYMVDIPRGRSENSVVRGSTRKPVNRIPQDIIPNLADEYFFV